ncbi:MAG TPA: hypothetical protein V6D21_16340 [Candidatus Obscuribacterales bacterium]
MKLDGLNIKELRSIAKERGFNGKDAALYGNAQRRATWVKLLNQNPEKTERKQRQESSTDTVISVSDYKPSKSSVRGLKRLPEIKTVVYFYGSKS